MILAIALVLAQFVALPPRQVSASAPTRARAIELANGSAIYDCDTSAGVGESSTPACRRKGARWSCAIAYRCVTDMMAR